MSQMIRNMKIVSLVRMPQGILIVRTQNVPIHQSNLWFKKFKIKKLEKIGK